MKPMGHFVFEHKKGQTIKAYFIQLMLEQGFLASNMFYAMYAHTEEDVERYIKAVETAFEQIARSIAQDDIEKKLVGKPSTLGFKRLA